VKLVLPSTSAGIRRSTSYGILGDNHLQYSKVSFFAVLVEGGFCNYIFYVVLDHTTYKSGGEASVSLTFWEIWAEFILCLSLFPRSLFRLIYIDTMQILNMEVAMENRSALSIAAEQHPPTAIPTYADFLRTIVNEYPEFSDSLERLEGSSSATAPTSYIRGCILGFGTKSILDRYFWTTKEVANIARRPPTPGTKTRINYIGYNMHNMENEGDPISILPLIDSFGMHLDLEPSFVDAVPAKLPREFAWWRYQRAALLKDFLDLHLEGDSTDVVARIPGSMDATICIKNPNLEDTAGIQCRKF
jgi:hypothetical protein